MPDADLRLCCTFRLRDDPGLARRAVGSGATLLIAECDGAPIRAAVDAAKVLRAEVAGRVPVLACGRVDVALAAGLDGAHLGQSDLSPADARRLLGPGALIGLDVGTTAEADELFRWRVDFARVVSGAADDAPSGEHFARLAFRVRLAAPGTPVVARTEAGSAGCEALIAASADGFVVPAGAEGGSLRALRIRMDEAASARARLPARARS